VQTYWEIGKRIVEQEQSGSDKPEYGSHLIEQLSADLSEQFGEGFSRANVFNFRRFYLTHQKVQTSGLLGWSQYVELLSVKDDKVREKLEKEVFTKQLSSREVKALVKERLSQAPCKTIESSVVETEFIPQLPCARGGEFFGYTAVSNDRVTVPKGTVVVDCGFNVWQSIERVELVAVDEPSHVYAVRVESVIDGDTFWAVVNLGFGAFTRQKFRLSGIDTPELDTPEGQTAKRYVQRYLGIGSTVVVRSAKSDKYDRYLADVFFLVGARSPKRILKEGLFLNQVLLDKGMAKTY
jgi:endonuclease YncB( thermonuclease family)